MEAGAQGIGSSFRTVILEEPWSRSLCGCRRPLLTKFREPRYAAAAASASCMEVKVTNAATALRVDEACWTSSSISEPDASTCVLHCSSIWLLNSPPACASVTLTSCSACITSPPRAWSSS